MAIWIFRRSLGWASIWTKRRWKSTGADPLGPRGRIPGLAPGSDVLRHGAQLPTNQLFDEFTQHDVHAPREIPAQAALRREPVGPDLAKGSSLRVGYRR